MITQRERIPIMRLNLSAAQKVCGYNARTVILARVLLYGSVVGVGLAGYAESAAESTLVIFLGDSLTAGFGISEEEAFPALVQEGLTAQGWPGRVVNAGVSGDTTAGGLSRLDWLLAQEPDVVVVGLGANDGLRGLSLEETRGNLRHIIRQCQESNAKVLLLGMKIPPSYGADYSLGFAAIFPSLADELRVPLVPFLLQGVAADPALNLPDGIHPNAAGHRRVAENVLPRIKEILD